MKKFLGFYFVLFIYIFLFCGILCEFSNEITEEEKVLILKLRDLYPSRKTGNPEADKFNSNWVNSTGDRILRNWVQYFDYDLDSIEKGLDKSLNWRRINNLQKSLDWIPPKYIDENFPWYISGYTEDGQAVFYIQGGNWNVREALRQNLRSELIKYMVVMTERVLSEMKKRNDKLGLDSGNVIIIADVKGFSLSQMASIRALATTASGLSISQNNYPFIHSRVFIVNVPDIFYNVLNVAKQVLSEKTFGRIFLYDSNRINWLPQLRNVIPNDAFPKELL